MKFFIQTEENPDHLLPLTRLEWVRGNPWRYCDRHAHAWASGAGMTFGLLPTDRLVGKL